MKKLILAALSLALLASPAAAQWQTPNHSVPIGRGAGVIGFGSVAPGVTDLPFMSNGASADPSFRVLPNAGLAPMAANTVKGSVAGGTPADLPLPAVTCASLRWTVAVGFGCSTNIGINVQTTPYVIQTSDCGGAVQVGTGTTGFISLTLPSAVTFPIDCTIDIINGNTWAGRGVQLLGNWPADFTAQQQILYPTQSGAVRVNSGPTAWLTRVHPGKAKLPAGTVTINTNNNNATGDNVGVTDGLTAGTTPGTAFKTMQNALLVACNQFDMNSTPQTLLTFHMAGVADTQPVHFPCPVIPGAQGGAAITITGDAGASISGANADAFAIDVNATVSFFGINLSSTGTVTNSTRPADCLRADFGGRIFYAGVTVFAACAGSDIAADNGGEVIVQGFDSKSGNSATHFYAAAGGVISSNYLTVTEATTLLANVTLSRAWAFAGPGGTVNMPNYTFLGAFTATGTRAATTGAGSIFTGAGLAACNNTVFPGTVNGAIAAPFCQ